MRVLMYMKFENCRKHIKSKTSAEVEQQNSPKKKHREEDGSADWETGHDFVAFAYKCN